MHLGIYELLEILVTIKNLRMIIDTLLKSLRRCKETTNRANMKIGKHEYEC